MNNFNQRDGKTFHKRKNIREYDFGNQQPEERKDEGTVWHLEAQKLCTTDRAPVFNFSLPISWWQRSIFYLRIMVSKHGCEPFPSASSSRREAWEEGSELEFTFVYKLRTGSKAMNTLCNRLGFREKGMEEPEIFTYDIMEIFVCCYFSNKEFLLKEKNFNI